MFAKVKERLDAGAKMAAASVGAAASGGPVRPMPSIVGPDMTVTGNMETPGEVHVEGRVAGDVTCTKLIIGVGGLIQGRVTAVSVKVHGKVEGAIDADEVYLLAGSEVVGDIFQGTLEIAPGALFEGAVRRRPIAGRPMPVLGTPSLIKKPDPLVREGEFEPVAEEPPASRIASPEPASATDAEEEAETAPAAAKDRKSDARAKAAE